MPGACQNCGIALLGAYCHACGQQAIADDELTVAHAVRAAADDLLHLESKTLRTIARLPRPGLLTAAYLEGHRASFTTPVKLYLACAAIFFLCAPLAGFTLEQLLSQDGSGQLAAFIQRAVAESGIERQRFAERFDLRFQTVYTFSLFVSVATGAVMLSLLFRSQRRPFGAHVVFELHYVSFLYLLSILLGVLLRWLPSSQLLGFALTLAVVIPYQFVALTRVYREPPPRILWKTLVLVLAALVVDNILNFVALVVTVKLI